MGYINEKDLLEMHSTGGLGAPVGLAAAYLAPNPPSPDETNPKDLLGVSKVSISKLPAVAILHGAHAMMNGAEKYGPYNWREKKVRASIYVDAMIRHALAWFEGEETADDSGAHHLGHAIACAAILLDAETSGNLVNDRPQGGKYAAELTRLNELIKQRKGSPK